MATSLRSDSFSADSVHFVDSVRSEANLVESTWGLVAQRSERLVPHILSLRLPSRPRKRGASLERGEGAIPLRRLYILRQ